MGEWGSVVRGEVQIERIVERIERVPRGVRGSRFREALQQCRRAVLFPVRADLRAGDDLLLSGEEGGKEDAAEQNVSESHGDPFFSGLDCGVKGKVYGGGSDPVAQMR